jgi:hypothetical protein
VHKVFIIVTHIIPSNYPRVAHSSFIQQQVQVSASVPMLLQQQLHFKSLL